MTTSFTRRRMVSLSAQACGAVALGASPPNTPTCDELRGRRISWLVGWSPGGGYDTYSRLLEPTLERALGAQIVIENVPGAAGAVAARRLSRTRPDGRTLGILNGTGLTIAPITNPRFAPDLAADFTILGRIADHRQMLVTGPKSGISSIEELRAMAGRRSLVLGETGPTTINVLLSVLAGDLFGVEVEVVMGFPGTQELMVAVVRGDVDAAVMSEESVSVSNPVHRLLGFGRPDHIGRWTQPVPDLFGADGLLESAPELFSNIERARMDGAALRELMAVGRLVAGPPGMEPALRDCLHRAVVTGLRSADFQDRAAQAQRTLSPLTGPEALDRVAAAKPHVERFRDRIDAVMERARG